MTNHTISACKTKFFTLSHIFPTNEGVPQFNLTNLLCFLSLTPDEILYI